MISQTLWVNTKISIGCQTILDSAEQPKKWQGQKILQNVCGGKRVVTIYAIQTFKLNET